MKKIRNSVVVAGAFFSLALYGCAPPISTQAPTDESNQAIKTSEPSGTETSPAAHRDTLTQLATIDALLAGGYHGWATISEMQSKGDFGLGTFEHLDGEMIQSDGKVFQVSASGRVLLPEPDTESPFFITTFFDVDHKISIPEEVDFTQLCDYLLPRLPSPGMINAIRIRGEFNYLKTRSVPVQSEPYPPLSQVIETQPIFEFEYIDGTLVGFFFPESFERVNVPGFHFHFISSDQESGGHVLDLRASSLIAEVDITDQFFLTLPDQSQYKSDH